MLAARHFYGKPIGKVLVSTAVALAAQLAAGQAFAAKDVTLAVASTFTTLDPYDSNDTLSQAVIKSFYQGLFGFDKDLKLVNVLAEGYDVSKDGLVYTIRLRKNVKFQDGTDFKADAVKMSLERVINPDNKLKRFNLFNRIAKVDVVNDYEAKITLKEPFSPFINTLAHSSAAMISPTALKQYGNKEIAFHPVGTGPFKFVEWKQTDYLKVSKFDGYWKKGYPKIDSITWKPVIDNNTRSAIMQTGEAQFAFPLPYEQADLLKSKTNLDLISAPSIVQRYISMNTQQKPFDNPKVREAINYAINKQALVKVAFNGYAVPQDGVLPQGVDYALKTGPWPYDVKKAKQLLTEAGYPNGFETELWSAYNHTTAQKIIQFVQQQLAQVGIKVKVMALEAGQRVEKVESAPNPATAPVRMYYTGWSSSTGEADWGLRPLLASESFPPKLFNTAYYKSAKVDGDIANALTTTDRVQKTALYKDAQTEIWKDAPWAFLVTEKLLYARSKNLKGMYVMPDGSFNFDEIELK
ncbi:glutathione ABC transporter substrate-binding protein GsiB [Glaciimonas sp. PAMC28666]|uniref:glutathione ABC transporter substrate-binding protein GsiB n=1 Tax=Glaciimonas sp. PAMC28666 TaxID=2807626 RepID=UPI001965EAF6|nr:glutathione ABC transporter substrate-binding protein GsiB [Glaciimonas sp. PAMC28666]QRX82025.1 glutathione ABC transporter substrate-binding protein GsiB [Glaciimonas sp. PAMC28666]